MKNNIHIRVARHTRKPLSVKDLRGRGHHFLWEVIVSTEDIDGVKTFPFHSELFKKSNFAFKLKRILGALASQGMSYEEIRNWIIKSDWIYKNSVTMDYFITNRGISRENILYWKWAYKDNQKQNNSLLYELVNQPPALLNCMIPNIIALRELDADVNYISQNGESVADAARRKANPALLGILGIN